MRDAVGNDDGVTFSNVMLFAAFNPGSANFIERNRLRIDCFPACDQGGRSIDNVNDIRVESVDFSLAALDAAAGVDFVVRGLKQWLTFREGRSDSLCVDKSCAARGLHHRRAV